MNTESVLITGASGFIGSQLTKELLRRGKEVLGLDLEPPGEPAANHPAYRFYFCDITRPETIPADLARASALVHCAALVHRRSSDLSRSNYFRVNCEGTRNILRSLKPGNLRRIVFLSTVSVYGIPNPSQKTDEQTLPSPADYYGESKLAAEAEILKFSQKTGIPAVIFRLAPVYGRQFLLNLRKRVYLPRQAAFYRIGNGEQRMSLCAAGNVVEAVAQCLDRMSGHQNIFNLKDCEDYSINMIIAAMRALHGHRHRPVIKLPGRMILAASAAAKRLKSRKGEYISYMIQKIAVDAVYSGEKLSGTGINLPWNMSRELSGCLSP